jgi:hypothetical protein
MPRLHKVKVREYILRDILTFEDLPYSLPFNWVFKPYQHINISIIFLNKAKVIDSCLKYRIRQLKLVEGFFN